MALEHEAESARQRTPPAICDANRASTADPLDPTVIEGRTRDRSPDGTGHVLAALGPVETRAHELAPLGPQFLDVDAERLEGAGVGDDEPSAAALERAGCEQGVGHRDAEASGEVVVAGSTLAERCADRGFAKRPRRPPGRDHRQRLDRVRDRWISEPVVPVSALALERDEAAVDELREVRTDCRRRPTGAGAQLRRRPSRSIGEGQNDLRAHRIAEQRRRL